jgi:hypothetical protein
MLAELRNFLMSLPGQLELGWSTGWWFTAAFGLVNVVIILRYGKKFARRLVAFPKFKSFYEKAISMASVFLFTRAIMVYTIFVPVI